MISTRQPVAHAIGGLILCVGSPAAARSVPVIDTEDATLGSAEISSAGRLHPLVSFDLRNGDFARGSYDDDRADLQRLPAHVQLGAAIDLTRDSDGETTSWLVLRSSNGFHAPQAAETRSPRPWYESNDLAALVFAPAKGFRVAAVYTIKASPNGVSATTNEASLSLAYDGADPVGTLSPTFVATVRPKGDSGQYTQIGIEPSLDVSGGKAGPKLSVPLAFGVGWNGFYGAGSGNRRFLSAGAALQQPFMLGTTHWMGRAEALALIRDARLAALSGPQGETSTVVPLVTLSLSVSY